MQFGDLFYGSCSPEVVGKSRRLVYQAAVSAICVAAQRFHDVPKVGCITAEAFLIEQRGLERGGDECFQVATTDFCIRILARDDFPLLCDADLPGDGAGRLRQYRLVARTAAAAYAAATAVEKPQADAVARKHLDQRDLRLVELPVRREISPVLVAVGVAEHDLLHIAAAREQPAVLADGKQAVHDGATATQIGDGFEQRHYIDCEPAGRARGEQAGLFRQQRHFQDVTRAFCPGNYVVRERVRAEATMDGRRGVEQPQFACRGRAVLHVRGAQWTSERKLVEQQPRTSRFG